MKTIKINNVLSLLFAICFATVTYGQVKPMELKQTNVVDYLASSNDHTTLVKAVIAAELIEVLSGEGPFTVFAPTNEAFGKLPKGTLTSLLEPDNKVKLQDILKYHVISGNANSEEIVKSIEAGNGKAELKTLNGAILTATLSDGSVVLKDSKGNSSIVTAVDIKQSNGVVHIIDSVVLPKDKIIN